MPVRLIALDIDGTLLDSDHALSEANRRAVAAAVDRGIAVALVTGRRFDFALPIAQEFSCPLTMIVNNGAVVKSKEGVTHLRHLLPAATARKVIHLMREFRKDAGVVFDRPGADQVVFESIDWEDPLRKPYLVRNREFISEMSPLENCLNEDPIQVMYTGSVRHMRDAEAVLAASGRDGGYTLAVTYYDSRDFGMVDVIVEGCSKGATLAEWAARCGVAREEIMAIGDNLNDREMLEFAGVPVIMANCVPELKSLGWRETCSNDESGVAAAIQEYALGGLRT